VSLFPDSRARLVFALDAVRRAFRDGAIEPALAALEKARLWALAADVPWACDLDGMIGDLEPALRQFRDIEERFDTLFPEDDEEDRA
jgi:hypothetical protein